MIVRSHSVTFVSLQSLSLTVLRKEMHLIVNIFRAGKNLARTAG
jgi:hypothetical protein